MDISDRRSRHGLLALLLVAFLLRLGLSGLPGFVGDTNWMIGYVGKVKHAGLTSVTDMWDNALYPPVFVYQAVAGSRIVNALTGQHTPAKDSDITGWARMGVRIGPIISDVCIGALLFLAVNRWRPGASGLGAAALYLFNPGTVLNSALWNYDAVPSLFILLTLLLASLGFERGESKWLLLAMVANAIAFSSKLQAGMYIPVFGLFLLLTRDWRLILNCAVVFLLVTALAYLPFMLQGRWDYLKKVFFVSFQDYPTTHVNGFNVWALWYQKPVSTRVLGLTLENYGRFAYLAAALFGAYALWKTTPPRQAGSWQWGEDGCRRLTIISAYLCIVPFLLLTRMHERYVAPAVALAVLAGFLEPRLRKAAWGFSLTYALNMIAVYILVWNPWATPGQTEKLPRLAALIYLGARVFSAGLNVLLFVWFTANLRRILGTPPAPSRVVQNSSSGLQPDLAGAA